MRKVLLRLLRWIFLGLISLRYKVRKENIELLDSEIFKDKPVLIMPNHTSLLDGLLVAVTVNLRFDLRPLVFEGYYKSLFFKPFIKLLNPICVPDLFSSVSQEKIDKTKELIDIVCKTLDNQGHVLIFPSGRMKHTQEELLGGRSLAYEILKRNPELDIILVRISGLYGSHLSRENNRAPSVPKEALRALGIVLINGIFFAPKRQLLIEFKHSKGEIPLNDKRVCNAYLEEWYNNYAKNIDNLQERTPFERVVRTKIHFLLKTKEIEQVEQRFTRDSSSLEDHLLPHPVKADLYYKISEITSKPVGEINQTDHLVYKLGMDSLDVASLYSHLESNYDIDSSLQPGDLESVNDVLVAAVNAEKAQDSLNEEKVSSSKWRQEKDRPEPCYLEAETLIEGFLNQSMRMNNYEIVADQVLGSMDFKSMRKAVVILAGAISKKEEKHIGIMLPSTIGCQLLILATMLANKIPVLINWTVGTNFTNHVINEMKLKTVISSNKFLKKVKLENVGDAEIWPLEEIKNNLTLYDKVLGLWMSAQPKKSILESFGAHSITSHDTAVMLYTSGSTGKPKGVPLTHANLMANHLGAMSSLDLSVSDVFIVPLPPFHVFGFNVSLLGILLGIKTVFSPDPLDTTALKQEIMKWAPSVIFFAPTFYKILINASQPRQLQSIRIWITGAEKAPASLREYVQSLGGILLEGYGLTETSPILAVCSVHDGDKSKGVGRVLSNIDLKIIDPKSLVIREKGQVGEIVVAGPSIFSGYYKSTLNPFIEIKGISYFRTGDLGMVDEDDFLIITGRSKRCIKRGAEMISLVAIEEALLERAKKLGIIDEKEVTSPFALSTTEAKNGTQRLVLFSEIDIALDKANMMIIESGFSRLFKLHEVKYLEQIPVLGNGKVDFVELDKLLGKRVGYI